MHSCERCRFWIAGKYYALDRAGRRRLDVSKIVSEVREHREHSVMSEAHFHYEEAPCNERCIA